MKEYLKSEIKHIPLVLILFILFYGITTLATTTLFASSEVKYNNTTSGIQSDKVQGAIDELYACASNYGAYNTRLTNTENTIGTGSLTTTSQTLIGGVNELNDYLTQHQDISGKVSGPSSSTNNNVAIFDGTGGKTIKDSGYTIGKSVPSDAKFSDTTYSAGDGISISNDNKISVTGVKDYNNGTVTKFGYSTSAMSSASWLAAWDGYNVRAIRPDNALSSASGANVTGMSWESGKTPSNLSLRKYGRIVSIIAYWGELARTTSWVKIGTLPSGARPLEDAYVMDQMNWNGFFFISTNGQIKVKANSALTTYASLVFTFIV